MKAVMLAAGIGARLGPAVTEHPPKVLLRFGGKSLLQRHVEILRRQGIGELVLGVGYHQEEIEPHCHVLWLGSYRHPTDRHLSHHSDRRTPTPLRWEVDSFDLHSG